MASNLIKHQNFQRSSIERATLIFITLLSVPLQYLHLRNYKFKASDTYKELPILPVLQTSRAPKTQAHQLALGLPGPLFPFLSCFPTFDRVNTASKYKSMARNVRTAIRQLCQEQYGHNSQSKSF